MNETGQVNCSCPAGMSVNNGGTIQEVGCGKFHNIRGFNQRCIRFFGAFERNSPQGFSNDYPVFPDIAF